MHAAMACVLLNIAVVRGAAIPIIILAPEVYTCRQFKNCRNLDDAYDVVARHIDAGPLPIAILVSGIPTKAPAKSDALLYFPKSLHTFGLDGDDRLRRIIADELLRRPLLGEKLADAVVSIRYPGPFAGYGATAEFMVEAATDVADWMTPEDQKERLKLLRALSALDHEVIRFFAAWALAGKPISLDGISRDNLFRYRIELARWYEAHRDRMEYDATRERFRVKPLAPGEKSKAQPTVKSIPTKTRIPIPYIPPVQFRGMDLERREHVTQVQERSVEEIDRTIGAASAGRIGYVQSTPLFIGPVGPYRDQGRMPER